jgi:DNA-binding IclR family transcriptional regulator
VIDGQAHWTCNTLQDRELDQVEELSLAGKTVREIADQIGLSKSKVSRMQMKLRTEGQLRN